MKNLGVFRNNKKLLNYCLMSNDCYERVGMHNLTYRNDPKFSDRYTWANSADPDQTAPRGAV